MSRWMRVSFPAPMPWAITGLCALLVLWSGGMRPDHDWDVIGYVAAGLHADGLRGAELHRQTYDSIRKDVGEQQFARLTDPSDPYRRAVSASPEALTQHLPFYGIRVLHVEAMRALAHVTGWPLSRALAWLNGLVGALAVCVCFGLMRALGLPVLALPVLIWWAGIRDVAKLSTPDGLACLLAMGSLLALLHRRWTWALCLAVVLPAARTDHVLWSMMVVVAVLWLSPMRMWPLLALVLSVLLGMVINHVWRNPGHLVIFNFTLVHKHPWPAEQPVASDWHVYAETYLRGLGDWLRQRDVWLWPLSALMLARWRPASRETVAVVAVALSFVIAHMLLFPLYLPRFFVASVTALSVVWLSLAWSSWHQRLTGGVG
jgi:hypothetical protein